MAEETVAGDEGRGTMEADYDVVILGAGINGAGLFRDLCEQGVRCLLVDKGDICAGTSAAPSRLIHGGLKYLETGEFRLVSESTYERNLLLRNAPHLVHPLPTVIPIYSWTKGIGAALRTFFGSKTAPRSRGRLLMKLGLWLYDVYGARQRVMPRHSILGREAALKELPSLTPDIVAVGTYYDAVVTAPERLVLELVKDGLRASPASRAMTWTDFECVEDGRLRFTGPDGETLSVLPKVTVNATGPWIDAANAKLGVATQYIGGTKGSHILLDHDALVRELDGRMIYFEGDDGRICLVFPYHGRALVGSTDIPADDPDSVTCEETEVDYFMGALRRLLPGLTFDPQQIVYAYSGIRPLPNSEGTEPGLISRDHSAPVLDPEPGRPYPVISLIGGKWTTFRAFSEQVADDVLKRLGTSRKTTTRELAIGGGRGFPTTLEARTAWLADASAKDATQDRLTALLDRYGTAAPEVATHAFDAPDRLVQGDTDVTLSEIDWIARNEQVVHLQDIVLRRTQLAITGHLSRDGLDAIATVAGAALGWSEDRLRQEVDDTLAVLRERHRVAL
ncbi:glycerol-3-phosphate dehydrogenase/oxidase [Tropicimonas isoalkanivorans]|uniref:Glycerol-3-phosphate dehydrogenase n=1 Tax=Tropicimonas isoalkanivorans TaxID=441112 RepID=A0A1I1IWQ7_9RHOB|nr:glycerol-3-phosphate dehydrogenase/oxidase [Tropicimonas isoalkanivorans]SFC40674.1 glycerol-3-phosphate dehydrogenase [Tropicimonas isoalkanivorans]